MDMVQKANSGHPGMPMGMADVVTVLFKNHLNFYPFNPSWHQRDRFILSAGHGSALLYSLLYLTGYKEPTLEHIKTFRQLHSPCAGHPEYGHLPGIETTTGPLGQGLANAVGMAIAQKKHQQTNNLNYKIYVLASDGDLMEGISHEACALAGHLNLDNLIILFDDNDITIDGPTTLSTSEDPLERFKSYGFHTMRIDGHNEIAIDTALRDVKTIQKPCIIACKTIIGKTSPHKEGSAQAHGSPLGMEEIALIRKKENWPHEPFFIPEHLLQIWRNFYKKSEQLYQKTKNITPFTDILAEIPFQEIKKDFHQTSPSKATRILFGEILEKTSPYIPQLIGGSSDLTPSNNTKTSTQNIITKNNFSGSYIHYGIREHAMGSIMNGLSLSHFLPYGGTFLVFSDYMRPAIRLSAIMKKQVFYIFTHDSIGLGEDGPTHQPVEHLCALRAIPNLLVFRPCDAAELLECWQIALHQKETPSIFALSRQNLPYLRGEYTLNNLSQEGGYILCQEDRSKSLDITLVATGSEVQLCIDAQIILKNQHDLNVRVVSMPCIELFNKLPLSKQEKIIGNPQKTIAVEASIGMSLKEALRNYSPIFIGLKSYGASAPASDLFKHFGITTENIVSKVL